MTDEVAVLLLVMSLLGIFVTFAMFRFTFGLIEHAQRRMREEES